MIKYVVGVIGTILLLVLVFIFVINRDSTPQQTNTPKVVKLTDYADKNSSVSLLIDGHLVSEEEHRAVRVTVSTNERRIEVLSGYDGEVIISESYPNSQAAYSAFLSGLGGAGFISSKKTSVSDPQSICVSGQHYSYVLSENGSEKSNLWSTSCDKTGTFNGRASTVRELFQRQIPNYAQHTAGVKL